MYFKWDLFRRHIKKWGYMAKNGFKWLFFCMEKTHKYINVRMSVHLSLRTSHFRVRAITPKPYGIYSWNFTGAYITIRRCVMNKEDDLAFLVFELFPLDLIPYSKPCPGHYSYTVWNIFMKLYQCMHHTEMMCHEQGRQLLHFWFLNYFPLTRFHIVNRVRAITPKLCPRLFEEEQKGI